MLLLSPGLALLLFGVSSVPVEGTVVATRVLLPAIIGIVLIAGFVRHAFRPEHPLIDLRLFKNKQLTLSVIGMFLFAMAFFGATLLLPSYFQQVRLEDTLHSGLLVAPQGIGAMITMPIAGFLADRIAISKIVVPGVIVICVGMAELTQVGPHTSYLELMAALFVMGLGMGATMMPLFTAALQTLKGPTIARGSTLVNIMQQIASSCGAAIMSVILTNQTKGLAPTDLAGFAHGFGFTFTVAVILVAVVLIPAVLLPHRKVEVPPEAGGEPVSAALTH
jgi:EmrB/QacA subfamily drug resistance transporter